jgi:hydroxymethylpyrimidine/phosphomethylpyrimidine kinase
MTIAGSDCGGGAGIQADLKTFASLGVHGSSVVTCLTAQNPRRVTRVQAISPAMVQAQFEAVFAELRPDAVKTGMLYSAAVIRAVLAAWPSRATLPLVVDPVMVSTSGAPLLRSDAVRTLTRQLLPRATLITPNLDEASLLLGRPLRKVEDLRAAARELHERFGCAVLAKGGHLRGMRSAVDFFYDGRIELLLEAPFVRGVSTHGTGCTYAAAIAGYLALGHKLPGAVQQAKEYVTAAITASVQVRRHTVLGHFWQR